MRTSLLLASLVAALASSVPARPAHAQTAPRRPRLASSADTNDAVSYYDLGVERFERDPDRAAVAFYWAARLDPASPQVWYAQYVARLARAPQQLVRYILRDRRTLAASEVLAIDSLRLRAVALDPFAHRGLEEPLAQVYAREAVPREAWVPRSTSLSDPEVVRQTERYLSETDPYMRGVLAYGRGELGDATRYWANVLASSATDWLWAERAAVFVELRQLDSARSNIERAIARSHGGAAGDARHVWETRAAYQCALGGLLEQLRNWAGAREAYQNAVAASAVYYPAWLRLGVLALRTGDTASAVSALARELELQPNDYFGHVTLGAMLNNRGHHDSALVHLRRATELEPWASGGWLLLARGLDAAGDTARAIETFQHYLALAPLHDAERLLAGRRIEQLQPPSARP